MNKKVIIGISISAVLVLTIVGAVIYKMLPPKAGEENNTQTQREDGLILEGDNLNAIKAEENIIIVDGDPEQETEYAGVNPEDAENQTKYFDENGNEVNRFRFDSSKITKQNVNFEKYLEGGKIVEIDNETKVIVKESDVNDCVYNYDQLYTEVETLDFLPAVKDDNYCGDQRSGYGDNSGVSGDMKILYIFGTDNLKRVDFSGIDLSNYNLIQFFNCNNIEYMNMGNYKNTVVKDYGWKMPVSLFTGMTVEHMKEINVADIEMAKWVKKELPDECIVKVNGEPVSGNLNYIVHE